MNRMLKTAAAVLTVGLGALGCAHTDRPSMQDRNNNLYDPCWPERYAYQAREAVLAPFAAHVANGAIVDATLYNHNFEPGTDRLLPSGLQRLDYLMRRRPAPDRVIYLQTARDLAYDPANPDAIVAGRQDLDSRRAASIQKYVAASTAGRNVAVDVTVVDPADNTFNAQGPANSVRGWPLRFMSGIEGVSSNNIQGAGGGAAVVTPGATGAAPATAGQR